jgi:hypothetical protein
LLATYRKWLAGPSTNQDGRQMQQRASMPYQRLWMPDRSLGTNTSLRYRGVPQFHILTPDIRWSIPTPRLGLNSGWGLSGSPVVRQRGVSANGTPKGKIAVKLPYEFTD